MLKEVSLELKRIQKIVEQEFPQTQIILFGSAADPQVKNPNDLDILFVLKDEISFKENRNKLLCISRTTWPLDIIVVPRKFFEDKVHDGGNFYAFIDEEGIKINEIS